MQEYNLRFVVLKYKIIESREQLQVLAFLSSALFWYTKMFESVTRGETILINFN